MRTWIDRTTLLTGLAAVAFATMAGPRHAAAQDFDIVDSAITLSTSDRAELTVWLDDGSEHRLSFANGVVRVDGRALGSYETDGAFAERWRNFLRTGVGTETEELRDALDELRGALSAWPRDATDASTARALGDRLAELMGVAAAIEETPAETATVGDVTLQIAPGGIGFDVAEPLARLREGLARLGESRASMEDRLAMIVHADYRISSSRRIEGDLALLGGHLTLEGQVAGDVLMLDGTLELAEGARVEGDILQVGGDLAFDDRAVQVHGEILSDFAVAPVTPTAPTARVEPRAEVRATARQDREATRGSRGPFGRVARNLGNAGEGLMGAISTLIGLGVLGILVVYFAQNRLETVSDTVRHEFARSFAMGLAGQVLFFPALLLLVVLVITWPIVPFFVLACALAALAGYIAVAHAAGEMFAQRRYRYEWLERIRRSNSYYYVLSGLVLLILPFAAVAILWVLGGTVDFLRGLIGFVACVGTWVLVTAGFGGVLLTRAGGRSVVVRWESDAGGYAPGAATADDPMAADEAAAATDAETPPETEADAGADDVAGADDTGDESDETSS